MTIHSKPGTAPLPSSLSARNDDILHGILMMCVAALLFPVMNSFVKFLSQYYSSEQVIWARNLGHFLFVVALFLPRRGPGLFRTRQPGMQMVRSLLLFGATAFFFVGVKHIPLVAASSISFTAPFIVTALSVPLLKERVGPVRWAAVLVGFVGTVIVIQPGSDVFHWASFLIFGSASCYALYQILTRRVAGVDPAETTVTYSALVGTLLMSVVVPFSWEWPQSPLHWLMFAVLGMVGGLGHYCITRAMASAPASVVSPFNYVQLLGATVIGYLMFDDFPDFAFWIGAAIVVASGLFMAWWETRRNRPPPLPEI